MTPSKCCRGSPRGVNDKNRKLSSLQDLFVRTNLDVILLGSFIAYGNGVFASKGLEEDDSIAITSTPSEGTGSGDLDESIEIEPTSAVLYPWFTQIIAIFIYYILSRYATFLPYAALVFILGFALGYFETEHPDNDIGKGAMLWLNIDGEVILLIFLPGLIFLESFAINVHLFFQAFWQLILFAFPMVLGGTALTALVGKYIFPYGWSFNLCMTFGAILAGTDPIAVAGLLHALGAPPRLQMHVCGESLLNDGSSMVFYTIFSARYFAELGLPNFGEDIGWGQGFVTFFRLSFGGAFIGLAFGLGTVMLLRILNRRLSTEENIMQVVTLISSAYLTYYTADVLCACSGMIATVACGLTVKVLGESRINDSHLALHFLEVMGQLLNTMIFVLGGTAWGNIINNNDVVSHYHGTFKGQDWGYLALLFIMLIVIRFILVFGFYPITRLVGIGSNWQEAVFMACAGFRGSIGIALSLSLYATILKETESFRDEYAEYRNHAATLFCMVGGITLFSLLIIGIVSKPILQLLGLTTPEKTREKVVANYRKQLAQRALASYVRLLSQERFKGLNFSFVMEHVPFLHDVTFDQLVAAVKWHKNNTPGHLYSPPHLEHVVPYLYHSYPSGEDMVAEQDLNHSAKQEKVLEHRRASMARLKENHKWTSVFAAFSPHHGGDDSDTDAANEARLNFIEILRSAYHHQIKIGELETQGDLHYSLFQSLEFCEDAAAKGLPLNDWEATKVASATKVVLVDQAFAEFFLRLKRMWRQRRMSCDLGFDVNEFEVWMLVRQALAFVRAHLHAQKDFVEHFASTPPTPAEEKFLDESRSQVMLAEADLEAVDATDLERIKGHLFCRFLLNESVQYSETLSKQGLIPEHDASKLLEELDSCVEDLRMCRKFDHEGKLSLATEVERLRQLPSDLLDEFNLWGAIEDMSRRAQLVESGSLPSRASDMTDDCLSSPLL